ncbi:formin-like [Schistosoma mansoni]|uniref:formin-like n=1 Tax=Schistosoma mansoni TaxID=6183 RepID=UPI00022DBFA1|nr:formin-like [Schistosoma mansoni]|eukprot:XP_018651603.1 formin-like [Schistosoma mansoni]
MIIPFRQDTTLGPRILYGSKSSGETYRGRYEMSCNAEVPNFIRNSGIKSNQFSPDNAFLPPSIIHSSCSPKGSLLTTSFLDFLEDCLHLSLRSLKAILNNQRGCRRAMEHALVISLVTFCLLHPNYSTKTLALDMLTALCLIEGGHVKVLQSFDRLRVVMGEGLRFELLLAAFRYHESLDVENYNLDFAVTCVQFLNIIVHSPENINLRVYLQYELHLLGFDDLLKQIRDRSGPRLKVQIEAYLDNRVDCSLLLEDAEAKEAAVLEQERLEKQLESEMIIAKKSEENFKLKETELLRVAESLRMKKREFEVAAADRESALYKQINELHRNIQLAQLEISDLRQNLHLLQTCTTKSFTTMSTSTHFENSRGNSSIANNSTDPNSSSDPPTLVTRAMSTEDNFSSLHHCNVPSCTLQNSTTCKQLANQAANYLAELVKLVSSLSATELFNAEHDSSNDNLIMIYPIGWEFSYLSCPSHRYHDDSGTTQLTISLDTIFNDQIFRTCYLANISMKAEGICTNSEDFFHIYSNQLPDLWFNAYKKLSQNLSNKQQTLTSVNSLHKTDDSVNTKHTSIFDDLHRLGLLETSSNNQSLENIEAVKIVYKDKEIEDNLSKSKLTEYLLHLKLNPIIAQRLINEIHYITENLISNNNNNNNNNNSFMIMNSSTIELFDQIENIFQKYFSQFNMDKLFFCITDTNRNQQRWFYLLSLLHGSLIKFTLIEELKLINELIDWQFTSPRISNTKSQIVQHDQQSSTTEIQVNEVKFLKTDFMSMFVKHIMKISPSLLNWTSELNQLDVVSRKTAWCILHSTAYWINRFQPISLSTSTSNIMLSDDWLNPLVRFASSFKNCVNDLDRKSRHSQNSSLNIHDTQSSSHSHHRHSQKHLKEQDKISSSSKRGNRHRKLRTRQLDTDGLMDDILHNLTLNPLRADIHVKRSDKID